ncbi:mucin-5AC-like [Wyeomyia smithii]|uniref:mucin-5AC-like n=1 Tax=Wyeomyia smithii TaxID=174621 RepID=UPI002467B5F6|nr:mucin-5AC-like [Wyeomyia smithii]
MIQHVATIAILALIPFIICQTPESVNETSTNSAQDIEDLQLSTTATSITTSQILLDNIYEQTTPQPGLGNTDLPETGTISGLNEEDLQLIPGSTSDALQNASSTSMTTTDAPITTTQILLDSFNQQTTPQPSLVTTDIPETRSLFGLNEEDSQSFSGSTSTVITTTDAPITTSLASIDKRTSPQPDLVIADISETRESSGLNEEDSKLLGSFTSTTTTDALITTSQIQLDNFNESTSPRGDLPDLVNTDIPETRSISSLNEEYLQLLSENTSEAWQNRSSTSTSTITTPITRSQILLDIFNEQTSPLPGLVNTDISETLKISPRGKPFTDSESVSRLNEEKLQLFFDSTSTSTTTTSTSTTTSQILSDNFNEQTSPQPGLLNKNIPVSLKIPSRKKPQLFSERTRKAKKQNRSSTSTTTTAAPITTSQVLLNNEQVSPRLGLVNTDNAEAQISSRKDPSTNSKGIFALYAWQNTSSTSTTTTTTVAPITKSHILLDHFNEQTSLQPDLVNTDVSEALRISSTGKPSTDSHGKWALYKEDLKLFSGSTPRAWQNRSPSITATTAAPVRSSQVLLDSFNKRSYHQPGLVTFDIPKTPQNFYGVKPSNDSQGKFAFYENDLQLFSENTPKAWQNKAVISSGTTAAPIRLSQVPLDYFNRRTHHQPSLVTTDIPESEKISSRKNPSADFQGEFALYEDNIHLFSENTPEAWQNRSHVSTTTTAAPFITSQVLLENFNKQTHQPGLVTTDIPDTRKVSSRVKPSTDSQLQFALYRDDSQLFSGNTPKSKKISSRIKTAIKTPKSTVDDGVGYVYTSPAEPQSSHKAHTQQLHQFTNQQISETNSSPYLHRVTNTATNYVPVVQLLNHRSPAGSFQKSVTVHRIGNGAPTRRRWSSTTASPPPPFAGDLRYSNIYVPDQKPTPPSQPVQKHLPFVPINPQRKTQRIT